MISQVLLSENARELLWTLNFLAASAAVRRVASVSWIACSNTQTPAFPVTASNYMPANHAWSSLSVKPLYRVQHNCMPWLHMTGMGMHAAMTGQEALRAQHKDSAGPIF